MTISNKKLIVSCLICFLLLAACSELNETHPEETVSDTEEVTGNEKGEEAKEDEPAKETKTEAPTKNFPGNLSMNLKEEILNSESLYVLVNKEYSIGEYLPADLVTVDVSKVLENPEIWQMRKVAADALKYLFEAAAAEGLTLHSRSGYRSYQTQVQLFNNYVASHGEVEANKFSSRPGHSEHQTGLSMDITSENIDFQLTEAFGDTKEGQWVAQNAHRFGFIIRYPKGKTSVTGYIYEPWHIRYLGEELATAIYESGLTYEEFLAKHDVI